MPSNRSRCSCEVIVKKEGRGDKLKGIGEGIRKEGKINKIEKV